MSLSVDNNNFNLQDLTIPKVKNTCKNKIKIKLKNNQKSEIKQFIKPTCSICLEEIEKKDAIKVKVCGHIFHKDCISEWVEIRNNCPMCRSVIKRKFDIYELKYKGLYKYQKRIFIDNDYFYIFRYNNKDKKKYNEKMKNNQNTKNNQQKKIRNIKELFISKEKKKNKKIKKDKTMVELFNSDNENYIYHYLLSIVRIQYRGKKMIIQVLTNKNIIKTINFYFKNVIDTQNCFKLFNDNIKKKKGMT